MDCSLDAYLDIETTGLYMFYADITVIGLYLVGDSGSRLVQLVGEEVAKDNLLEAVEGVDTIFTYNGKRFDLPFIRNCLGVNLAERFYHHDLMYDCWRNNLYGGLKAVEQQLGIARRLKGVSGADAVRLWWRYRNDHDYHALNMLLEYNKEDVLNLKTLRQILAGCRP